MYLPIVSGHLYQNSSAIVCGTNGITYYNQCHWKVMSCRAKATIPIEKKGRCGTGMNLLWLFNNLNYKVKKEVSNVSNF